MCSLNREEVDQFDLADPLIKIWDFSEHVHHMMPEPPNCTCKENLLLCIEAARNKW